MKRLVLCWVGLGLVGHGGPLLAQDRNSGFEGSYTVPAGEFLPEAVDVDMERARFMEGRRGRIRLDYQLPKVLDGASPKRFVLQGKIANDGTPAILTGNGVSAVCARDRVEIACTMQYDKNVENRFALQDEAAEEYLASLEGLDPARLQELRQARLSLSHEAIGIIHIRRSR